MTYEQLEADIAAWAAAQSDIRAVIAVGSRARGDADRWSDLDLLLFTHDRARYSTPEWLNLFGDVLLTYLDEAAPGDPEWFVIYSGGLKLDVVLLHTDDHSSDLESLMRRDPYQAVFARGVKVLFDRSGSACFLPPQAGAFPAPPSAAAFDKAVSQFLVESVTTAKFIARGDFWRAQWWFAHDLRPILLKLLEWHAHERDTWYNGRFINVWADPRALAALPQTFATCERESLCTALQTMLRLCQLLGEETAARSNFTYPTAAHRKIIDLIDEIFWTA